MRQAEPKHLNRGSLLSRTSGYRFRVAALVAAIAAAMFGTGGIISGPGLLASQPAVAQEAPAIQWGFTGGSNPRPGDGQPLFLRGFDFSKPVTVSLFGATQDITYYPGAPLAWYSPSNLPIGTYKLWARQGSQYAEQYVYVGDYWPWTQVSQYWVHPGENVTFWANDFKAGEQVVLLADGQPTGMTATAGTSVLYYYTQGKFQMTFTPPASWAGRTVHYSLVGQSSHKTTDHWITIANW